MPKSNLSPRQRSLLAELRELAELFLIDFGNIEEYDRDTRTTRLELMRRELIRGQVVHWYTYIDELLSYRIIRLYFPVRRGPRLWETKRFRLFNQFVLEELSLLAKMRFARAVKELSKPTARTVEQLNTVRNGLAHAFFPETLKRSKPVWKGKDLFTLDGARALHDDVHSVINEMWADFEAYGNG
jgi:hypothetical protein